MPAAQPHLQPAVQPVRGPRPEQEVTITVCPQGPLLVRGPVDLRDGEGAAVEQRRSTLALCRCGASRIAPFCDGSHKRARWVR